MRLPPPHPENYFVICKVQQPSQNSSGAISVSDFGTSSAHPFWEVLCGPVAPSPSRPSPCLYYSSRVPPWPSPRHRPPHCPAVSPCVAMMISSSFLPPLIPGRPDSPWPCHCCFICPGSAWRVFLGALRLPPSLQPHCLLSFFLGMFS